MHRYTDRVVLVTGAGQGLGAAMARRFAAEGATVAVSDVNVAAAEDTARSCGGTATAVDVTDAAAVQEWVAGVLAAHGRVDVLVNNAGVLRDNRLERMSAEDWQTVVDVSLRGAFHCARAVFGPMKRAGYGRILSVSSICWRGNYGQANYATAKAGIVGLARTIALEGAGHGITSNVVSPGVIDTPMLAALPTRARNRLTEWVPVGRVGRP
jgi:NAD(P)-dependent dehydrogenase (short-subunit alcohol dehydrogenase family)